MLFCEIYRVLKPGGTFLICNEVSGDEAKDEKWTKIIEEMTIYKDTELKIYLGQAMFRNIQIRKKNDWLCVTAEKVRDIMSKKSNGISACGNEPDLPRKKIFKPLNTGWIDENVALRKRVGCKYIFLSQG